MSAREYIAPAPHEADVFLWFDDNDLAPYWAVANLLSNTVDGGKHELTTARDGERWTITLMYAKSGIAPRPEDDVNGDVLYEFDLSAEGPYHKSVHYNISPRYDDMRGPDGDRLRISWCGGDGVDVHAEGSNIPPRNTPTTCGLAYGSCLPTVESGSIPATSNSPAGTRRSSLTSSTCACADTTQPETRLRRWVFPPTGPPACRR